MYTLSWKRARLMAMLEQTGGVEHAALQAKSEGGEERESGGL